MFTFAQPVLVHEVGYVSSGVIAPRDVTLGISVVRYTSDRTAAPAFVATSDLQGREKDAPHRLAAELIAEEIVALQELQLLPYFDFCALCGDFYDYPDLRKIGGTGDVTEAINAMAKTATRTFLVLGNHDEVRRDDLHSAVALLDGNTVETGTYTIAGVSGIVGDPHRSNRRPEGDFLRSLGKCCSSKPDFLLLHQGPSGATEHQKGSASVTAALKARTNLFVLFGHVHWQRPFHQDGGNAFWNVDSRVLAFIPSCRH